MAHLIYLIYRIYLSDVLNLERERMQERMRERIDR